MADAMKPEPPPTVVSNAQMDIEKLLPLNPSGHSLEGLELLTPEVPQPLANDEQLGQPGGAGPRTVRGGDYRGSLELIAKAQLPRGASQREINNYVGQLFELNPGINPRTIQPDQQIQLPTSNTAAATTGLGLYGKDIGIGEQQKLAAQAASQRRVEMFRHSDYPPEGSIGTMTADPGWLSQMENYVSAGNMSIPDRLSGMASATSYYFRNSNTAQATTQILGGVAEGAGAIALADTGVGAPLAVGMWMDAVDNTFTGVRRLFNGEPQHTTKYELVRALDGSEQFAQDTEIAVPMLLGVGAGALAINGLALGTSGAAINSRTFGNYLESATTTPVAGAAPKNYGVAFFGEDNLTKFYSADKVLIGAPNGKPFYFMPLEDSALVTDPATAARYSGMARSVTRAYVAGDDIYGISFPTDGMAIRLPTTADAEGWLHFLEGGNTAVLGEGPNAGYLVNPTREFVVPGGSPAPAGSVSFKLGPARRQLGMCLDDNYLCAFKGARRSRRFC